MLYIHGAGHFHPENVIDNAFFESLNIGTNDQWIMERVGIKRRRTVLPLGYIIETKNSNPLEASKVSLYTDAQTGAKAARVAIDRAGIKLADIGMVIGGGCTPQYLIPSSACTVAGELGLLVPSYDINSACSSFAFQIHNLMMMNPDNLPDYILIVDVDNVTRTIDYNDRKSAVLFGDASSAIVVSPRKPSRMKITFSTVHNDPLGWNKISIPNGGYFSQEGPAVQAFAIRKTERTLKTLHENSKCNPQNLYFIGHQANLFMLQGVCKRCGIDPSMHLFNVDEYGNCGAVGAPSVLSMEWEKFKNGDEIALVVVGSGLSWGGMLMKVEE